MKLRVLGLELRLLVEVVGLVNCEIRVFLCFSNRYALQNLSTIKRVKNLVKNGFFWGCVFVGV